MTEAADLLVIGGGPSAYAALLALTASGQRPTVLTPLGAWTGSTVDPGSSSKSGLARKTRNGSTEMYRYPSDFGARFDVAGPVPVSALPGGLSTVWGSNIEVFSGDDLEPWGPAAGDLGESYASVLSQIEHQGADDGLSARFPWPVTFPGRQPISRRVERGLARARGMGGSEGVLVGRGRNATAGWGRGCIACGQCLDGCPEGVIFDAGPRIARLIEQFDLPVIDGLATTVAERVGEVRVEAVDRQTRELREVVAGRVLLGAGSIASTALLVGSGLVSGVASLDDTQVFYAPILPTRAPDPGPNTYALAQMFVTGGGQLGDADFHLSIYESDPSFAARTEGLIGPAARLIPRRAYRQLMAAIGFIPASASGRIVVQLKYDRGDRVTVSTVVNPRSRGVVASALRRAAPRLRGLGMHVLTPLAQVSDVGASYHVGHLTVNGQQPIDVASGLVSGTSAVHVIDGAALPIVPTGPVTLTMMANAHRIARTLDGGAHG